MKDCQSRESICDEDPHKEGGLIIGIYFQNPIMIEASSNIIISSVSYIYVQHIGTFSIIPSINTLVPKESIKIMSRLLRVSIMDGVFDINGDVT